MDAVEIMEEYGKMCCAESEHGCASCELSDGLNGTGEACEEFIRKNPTRAVEIIEKYKVETSKNTRQSEFLKMFPNARIDDNGTLLICPRHVDVTAIDSRYCLGSPTCTECLKEYWLSEDSEEDN